MNNGLILWADDEIELLKAHIIFLEKKGYLPSVQGNNIAWELRNRNGEHGVYFTKTREIIYPDALLKEMVEGFTETPLFVLLYHSTPEAYYIRKENR